jgi:phage-related protein
VKNVANSLGNLQQKSAQAGQAFRKNITDAFNKVSNGVKPVIDKILSLRSPMDSAGQAGQRLRERISTAVQGLNLAVIKAIGSAIRQFQNLSTRAASAANAAVGSLRNLASQANSALSRFASSVQQGIQRAVTFFGQLPGRAVSALQGLNASLYTAGVNAIQGLYNGIVSKAGSVISYVSNLAGQVAGAFRRALGIASPSKLFAEYGGNIVEGLIRGLESQEKGAVKSGDDLAKSVIQGAQTSLERASASLKQTAQLVTSRLASAGPNPKLNKAFKTQGEAAIRALTNGLDDGREAAQAEVKTIVERISAVATKAMKGQDAKTKKALQNQAKSLQQWVKGQGAALDAVWREVDRARTRLDTARGKLKELQDQFSQLSSSFRDQLRGEIDLGSAIQSDGTATFDQVAANVSGLAAKMKTFAGLLKKLIAEGLPPALVQEVASLGTEKGIAIARALLSGTDAQRSSLVSDFKSIQSSTASIGNLLADQMYGAGIEAQKGLIKGLEANEKALVAAAKKIAQRITNEVKKELGIKSPSKVFEEIGLNITQGLANGIDQGQRVVDQSMRRLVPTDALNNLNAPLSSLAAQGAGGGSLRGGGTTIAEGAIQIVTPFANPRLVAQEFMDALAARGK